MKLTAYDLSPDKGAILASFLAGKKQPAQVPAAKPVPMPKAAPQPAQKAKPVPKAAVKTKPAQKAKAKPAPKVKAKPKSQPSAQPRKKKGPPSCPDTLERAKLVYAMQKKGMEKAAIMQQTGMTENQYKAALRSAHSNGIIPAGFTFGQRKTIPITDAVITDLRRLSRACFCEKYGCSVKTVSLMRKRLGITNVVFSHRWYAEDVARLFEHRAAGLSYEAIGAIYGVTGASIGEIIRKAKARGIECYPLRPKNK